MGLGSSRERAAASASAATGLVDTDVEHPAVHFLIPEGPTPVAGAKAAAAGCAPCGTHVVGAAQLGRALDRPSPRAGRCIVACMPSQSPVQAPLAGVVGRSCPLGVWLAPAVPRALSRRCSWRTVHSAAPLKLRFRPALRACAPGKLGPPRRRRRRPPPVRARVAIAVCALALAGGGRTTCVRCGRTSRVAMASSGFLASRRRV